MMNEPSKEESFRNGSSVGASHPIDRSISVFFVEYIRWESSRNEGDTLTFDDFVKELSPSPDQSVESTMKRAFREGITESVSEGDMSSVCNLLLELHQAVRALVPNRPDLHSILSDEDVKNAKTIKELLPYVVATGDAIVAIGIRVSIGNDTRMAPKGSRRRGF